MTTLSKSGNVSGSVELDFLSPVAIAGIDNDYSITITGIPTGSTTARSRTVVGDYT
ncbi:hypothetical protein [Demequina rhizosphaerae]|uniref:hypothetical protein n=1 Tax=Demequina rhizosphaerae TaxID=1638985 RepID=UPI0012DFFA60|nr:hypothetical protein [Demequina rhizosphaerae]